MGVKCNKLVTFRWETLPTLRYLTKDNELALGMILMEFLFVELHYIRFLQVFCVCQEDGEGGTWTVKAKSCGEDPKAFGDLVSFWPSG